MANTITDILNTWAQVGIFAYVLPFLIIFAIIFGILNKTKILGDNKGVQATISIAIGLTSLQFDYVSNFFATIFPYAGMGIAVLLIALILLGLGTDEEKGKKIWLWLGVVIFAFVILNSFNALSWFNTGYPFFQEWGTMMFWGLLIVGVVIAVVKSQSKGNK